MSPKDAFWFRHDANARRDEKMLALVSDHGLEGYGRFWVVVEMLREQGDYRLRRSKYLPGILAREWWCSQEQAAEFLDKLINEYHLLNQGDEFIWSDSLCRRMAGWDETSEKHRQAALKRWDKAGQMPGKCDENALHKQGYGIGGEGREMNGIEEIGRPAAPSSSLIGKPIRR